MGASGSLLGGRGSVDGCSSAKSHTLPLGSSVTVYSMPRGWRGTSFPGCSLYSARHSRPSKRESTGPRQYRSAGGGGAPLKSTRKAAASESDNSLIEPGLMLSDNPERPPDSVGEPQSGPASRGKRTNSNAAI